MTTTVSLPCCSTADRTDRGTPFHIELPAVNGLASHTLAPWPNFILNLQYGSGSNGKALPALTATTESDTSAPSTMHLPRTVTLAGPLTILTFRRGLIHLIS